MAGWAFAHYHSAHDGGGNDSGGGGSGCTAGFGGGVGAGGAVGESGLSAWGRELGGPSEGGDVGESLGLAVGKGEVAFGDVADDLFCGV